MRSLSFFPRKGGGGGEVDFSVREALLIREDLRKL